MRRVQKGKQAAQEKEIRQSYQAYLDLAASLVERAEETLRQLASGLDESVEQKEIVRFVSHAHRQIDQIDR
ncbi:MAG TPA: ISNCY family transposase, partial [Candidatus Latescibacteria bacterium]|nr:ISNCY family transposase [Candidatus Latescibacterota bacterium]